MPTVNTGQRTSFNDRPSVKDNIDNRLDFLSPTDLPLLSYLGFMKDAGGATSGADTLKFACTQTRHTWFNDDLVPSVSAVQTAYTAAGGTLVVTADTGEYFAAGDIIMVNDMYAHVDSVSNDSLTITELNSTGANAAVGDVVYIISNARAEGTAASDVAAHHTDFGSVENFTQIIMGKVDLTGSEQATERWGIDGDPYEYQLNKRLKELAIELERGVTYNLRNSSYPASNAEKRRFGGLAYYIRDGAGANVTNAQDADLDEILLNDLLQSIWEDGGMPDTIMLPMRQKRMLNAFLQPAVRVGRDESIYGTLVGTYISDAGSLDVIVNRWMKPTDLIVLTRNDIGVGPLKGNGHNRAFFVEELPKDGDYDRTQIIGEYTCEVRNATKSHGWIENLSKS
jgi:hypothetical protein